MILSICVYLILAFTLYMLARDYIFYNNIILKRTGKEGHFFKYQIYCSILIFAIICGVRYNVGIDNLMYINFYETYQNSGHLVRDNLEPLFELSMKGFGDCGFHWSLWLAFLAAIQIGFTYLGANQERYILPYLALFIVLGPTFLSWTNGLRQSIVICIMYWAIQYVENKRFWTYCLIILICYLIHKSAIILLPLYFIYQRPWVPDNRFIMLWIVIICTIIGLTPTWLNVMNNIKPLLETIDYDTYAKQLNAITSKSDEMAWGPGRLGIWLLDLIVIYYYPMLKKKYGFPKIFEIYFFAFFWGICAFNLFANTSHIFLRPIAYMRDFRLFIVPITLYFLKKDKNYAGFYIISVLAFFYTLYCTIRAYLTGVGENSAEVYKFFFLQ